MKKKVIALILSFTMIISMVGCTLNAAEQDSAANSEEQQSEAAVELKDLKLNVGSAPGPVTYPLAKMAEDNSNIILEPWQSSEQLTSMITAKEVQLCSTPVSNALLCYNKGLDVKLLMVTVWGMLYVMSTDSEVRTLEDLKGKEIVLSGQGGLHDLIFRHLLIQNNIDPDKDLTITYMDMSEASSLIATGKIKYAVLNEPQSTLATLNAKKGGVQLNRVLDLTEEWNKLPGQENVRMPMAGVLVVNDSGISASQATGFENAYIDAAAWVNENAEEIGPIVERHVPSMKAAAVTQSLKYARLDPVNASACREDIESFFMELSKTANVSAFGGKLPDAEFYY